MKPALIALSIILPIVIITLVVVLVVVSDSSEPPPEVNFSADRKLNMKQVGLAMHNYADRNSFLLSGIRSEDGTDLLSWRVSLLPYIDQAPLYERFNRREAWNTSQNLALLPAMPSSYRGVVEGEPTEETPVMRPTGPGTAAALGPELRFRDLTDGTSNTVAVINFAAQRRITWTMPADAPYAPSDPLAMFGDLRDRPQPAVLKFDGSVHLLNPDIDPNVLRALIDPQDGLAIHWP